MIQTNPFRLTKQEFRESFNSRNRRLLPVPYWVYAVVGLLCIPLGFASGWKVFTLLGATLVVLVGLIYALGRWVSMAAMALPMYQKEWTVRFEDDRGIAKTESGTEAVLMYADIAHVVTLNSYLMVYLGPSHYHVVPRRAFVASSDLADVVDLLRRSGVRVEDRTKPAPPPAVRT